MGSETAPAGPLQLASMKAFQLEGDRQIVAGAEHDVVANGAMMAALDMAHDVLGTGALIIWLRAMADEAEKRARKGMN